MSKILFWFFILTFVIFSYLFIDPNFFYLKDLYSGFMYNYRLFASIGFFMFVVISFIISFIFITKIKVKKITESEIIKIILPGLIILLFSYPAIVSFDIFNYIATAKVAYFYRENPYIIMPIEFIGDPLLQFMHAANKTALYGISWVILSVIPFFLGFRNILVTLYAFKIFVSLFYFLSTFLLWRMTKNIFAVSLFALNPLVIFETLVSGHNDIVMMFFALLAFQLLFNKKIILSIFLLIISILIKYATIFLLPVYLYILWNIIKDRKTYTDRIFLITFFSMVLIFFISPLREEMYPWYALWFLIFLPFLYKHTFLIIFCWTFSFGLMLRYIPFMYSGTYFGTTPILKILLTITPLIILIILFFINKKWLKKLPL